MRRDFRLLLRAGGLVLLLAVAVVVTGIYNVSARAGHFSATAWLLHFTMRQSARAHSAGIEVPPLDGRDRVVRGAAHFALACASCHGAPGNRSLRVSDYMTPAAPELGPLIGNWRLRELYWVVAHGIKYTGMPAWPTGERPDEVWDVVAFLRVLPRLDAAGYRALAFPGAATEPSGAGDVAFVATLAQCATCHGYDGRGHASAAFPVLAGQHETYLASALDAYAGGRRASGTMQLAAASLDASMRQRLAEYYSQKPLSQTSLRGVPASGADARSIAEGALIAASGRPERRIPDCNHCHGEPRVADNAAIPRLAGQPRRYLETQLHLWQSGTRGGGPYAAIMGEAASQLRDDEIRALSAYYEALPRVTDPWQ